MGTVKELVDVGARHYAECLACFSHPLGNPGKARADVLTDNSTDVPKDWYRAQGHTVANQGFEHRQSDSRINFRGELPTFPQNFIFSNPHLGSDIQKGGDQHEWG